MAAKKGPPAKRADARRNIAAIVDAAIACLSRNPDASIGEIAERAGVGRVTLYGHFASRAELVDAVLSRVIEAGNESLESVDLTGDPRQVLVRLIHSGWQLLDQFRSVLVAAQNTLSPGRIFEAHAGPAQRVQEVVERGQAESVFRDDLPVSWLVATIHSVMNGAAGEINAGRLAPADAAGHIAATVLAALTPPGQRVPSRRATDRASG